MGRRTRNVPHAVTQDGPFLAAILDTLDDLYDLLAARLPRQAGAEEPNPDDTVPGAAPTRLTEPAPPAPAPITEPAPPKRLPAPPRNGRGSGSYFWAQYARSAGLNVPDGASRPDIIRACQVAGLIPAEEA